jgi:hypothetical protein
VEERTVPEQAAVAGSQRLGAERRDPVVEVGLAEVGVPHPGHAQRATEQGQRVAVGYGAEDEVGMFDVGPDEPGTGGLDGSMDGLDGLIGGGQVGPDDSVDVADVDLPHGQFLDPDPSAGLEPAPPGLVPGSLPLT